MAVAPFFVSSPGKVIIYGEHSAVYGKPAIAAALDMRAFMLVKENVTADQITLEFPDIELKHSWNVADIPWDAITKHIKYVDGKPQITEELVPEIIEELRSNLEDLSSSLHYVACHCFLYLYCQLCSKETPAMYFCIRSTLPIGAGLGSSAATAVCLATSMSLLGGHVAEASLGIHDKAPAKESADAAFIDKWTLMGEMCFHGNPSGIDNAVATHGGAVMFQRIKDPSQPSVRTSMKNFPPLNLLLTNTKIPRSTAALVAGVSRVNTNYPKISASILEAMENISNDAYQIMLKPFFGKEEKDQLRDLININHGLLVALGVSHPSLEQIKIIGDSTKIGATKLTGAGGGGCAITLLNDEVEPEALIKAIAQFQKNGFETFKTSLGGKGVGVLSSCNVEEKLRSLVFSQGRFLEFGNRDEIIEALGVNSVKGWKFW